MEGLRTRGQRLVSSLALPAAFLGKPAAPQNPPTQQARGLGPPPGLGTTALCPGVPISPSLATLFHTQAPPQWVM